MPTSPKVPSRTSMPLLLVVTLAATAPLHSQVAPMARIEAGAVNPEDPLQVTLGLGAAVGLMRGSNTILLRAVRQSRDRNDGRDLTEGRTFVLVELEHSGTAHGDMLREPFFRLGVGALLRDPFKTTWVLDAAVGLRYQFATPLGIVGSLGDLITYLPAEDFQYCITDPDAFNRGCFPATIKDGPQHNLALTVAIEWRP